MTRTLLLLAATALATACASTEPRAPSSASAQPAATACDQLQADIAATEEDKRAAVDKRDGAWKVVVPFAVIGRAISGSAQADRADAKLEALHRDATAKGCMS